jgi:hypothetical protein
MNEEDSMRAHWIAALAASAALGLSAAELNAQGNSGAARGQQQARQAQQQAQQQARQAAAQRQRDAERAREQAQRERDRRDSAVRPGQQARGQGPAFCRSGQGHPVHGRQWCVQKGFGLGAERWDRTVWGDIILGQPRDRRRYDDGRTMGRGTLGDILGDVLLGRFESYGRQHGSGPVTGNWVPGADAAILQLSIGGVPFAQLVDNRRNGRIDSLLLRR